ncbi:DUF342 domain-containing protein [Caminibacter mediatlanticus TB-2]|uniref:DUF342 domain-containing protein n=1 Tax=Caminibacter mediatlanticus TB-2 TaxID=391592 RepID=A0ABX5VC43_9BACT|nr:flagellar assembly protein A [Caminibacter mediatlanticus]QCT94725.1 DUF342 domain-containing protein [Caminibacter mediatlanticus TB-2]
MGLLDFLKNDKNEEKKDFNEKIVICENVNEELIKVSKEYNIPLSSLDFDVLSVKTYIKLKDEDFIEADKEALLHLQDRDFLLNEDLEIKQVYQIKIKKFKLNPDFEILGKLEINKNYTIANFIFSPKSNIKEFNEVKFYEEMNKKKLRSSLFINLFDDKLKEDIKNLSKIYKELKEEYKVELCRGIDQIPTINGKIIYHYKKHKKSIKKELIYPIKKNELVIEIIKPKEGRVGRNCKGKIIPIEKLKDFTIPEIDFDEKTIEKKEDENKISYFSKKDGYVVFEENKYLIKDELDINQINIKTGNVTNAERGVKINVKESDLLKEAIADDMVVESEELRVKGNVGNKAKVKAKKLIIEGQTHKNAIIYATNSKINKHKGFLEGKNIEINSLENGRVIGKNVKVKMAMGGEIIAHSVEIENLLSHTKIYALKIIVINNLKGEENLLVISPKRVLKEKNTDELLKEVEEIEHSMFILKREIKKKKETIDKNKSAYEQLKNTYNENKKRGKSTSSSILMKLKEYKLFYEKYEKLMKKYKNLKKEKEELLEIIDNIQNAIYNAKIVSKTPWIAYNRIEFDLLEPPVSLKYDTKGDEGICGFKLKFISETPKIVKIRINNDSSSKGKNI